MDWNKVVEKLQAFAVDAHYNALGYKGLAEDSSSEEARASFKASAQRQLIVCDMCDCLALALGEGLKTEKFNGE